MYDYLVQNPVITLILGLLATAFLIFVVVKLLQNMGLEKIRAVVYKGFREAEYEFEQGANTEKFNYVVQLAKNALPTPFNLLITEKLLRKVIQLWFNLCKDFLDDWKLNGSSIDEEVKE